LVVAVIAFSSLHALAQEPGPPQRQDSVTVSAGISKEQLALEDRLKGIVSQGDQELRNGNATEAIKQYESALEFARSQPLLAEQRKRVMEKLAAGYIAGQRATDAIPIYSTFLDEVKEDCESKSTALDNCGDAHRRLGIAKASAGDFSGALASLREARAAHVKSEPLGDHEWQMVESNSQALTDIWIAVALFRLGQIPEAITTIETAIPIFSRVGADNDINPGLRDSAARSLEEAQMLLSRFRSVQ
jgi:tetratricopeptide (TPR) repeat protein